MGEIAELMGEGVLYQECGVLIDGDDWPNAEEMACGYPGYCFDWGGDPECNGAVKRGRKVRTKRKARKAVR